MIVGLRGGQDRARYLRDASLFWLCLFHGYICIFQFFLYDCSGLIASGICMVGYFLTPQCSWPFRKIKMFGTNPAVSRRFAGACRASKLWCGSSLSYVKSRVIPTSITSQFSHLPNLRTSKERYILPPKCNISWGDAVKGHRKLLGMLDSDLIWGDPIRLLVLLLNNERRLLSAC